MFEGTSRRKSTAEGITGPCSQNSQAFKRTGGQDGNEPAVMRWLLRCGGSDTKGPARFNMSVRIPTLLAPDIIQDVLEISITHDGPQLHGRIAATNCICKVAMFDVRCRLFAMEYSRICVRIQVTSPIPS